MSPTMVSFGNGERGATVNLTRHTEGTRGAIILVPLMRQAPLTTLYVRLPEDEVLKSLINGVVLAGVTAFATCQMEKNGPTASEITNCCVSARV